MSRNGDVIKRVINELSVGYFFLFKHQEGGEVEGCFLVISLAPREQDTLIRTTCLLKINTGYCLFLDGLSIKKKGDPINANLLSLSFRHIFHMETYSTVIFIP